MNNKDNLPASLAKSSASDTAESNSRHEQVEQTSLSAKGDTSERPRHDEIFKKVMSEPIAAREFLEHYLPVSFKNKMG